MSKVNLPSIPGGYLSLGAMNSRLAAIEAAFDNTLSLDGSLPNSMEADLDMDSNDILNVGLISVDDINVQGLTTGGILTEASEAAVAAGISAEEAEQSALDASANAEAKQVDSVSELRTSTFPANIQRLWLMGYYGVGTAGGGPLYRDSGDTVSADNGGTVFVDADGVRWKRNVSDTVLVDWFGVVGDGVTEEEDKIQSAVSATPENGRLVFPDRDITILVDVPVDAGAPMIRQRAVYFDKPMTVSGGKSVTKIKDFSTAWSGVWGTDLTGLSAYQIESSGVTIDGLVVDANADNHYEVDANENKFWETGPDGRRPPFGISIQADNGSPNITNWEVKNCTIHRPLSGIAARGALGSGSLHDNNDPGFIDGSLEQNLVVDGRIHNNKVFRARGNDYAAIAGVRSCRIYNNESIDSQYHVIRWYGACIDCHAYSNHALVDYARIESRYNQTDLGFWRTDDATSDQFQIRRSGYRIGSSSLSSSPVSTTIGCSMTDNTIRYEYGNSITWSDIVSGGGLSISALQVFASWRDIVLSGNKAYNPPYVGMYVALDPGNEGFPGDGVSVKNNYVFGAPLGGADIRGDNVFCCENRFVNCGEDANQCIILRGEWQKFIYNKLEYSVGGLDYTGNAIAVADSLLTTNAFISDNSLTGYAGDRVNNAADARIHGTDGGGFPLILSSGWVLASTGANRNDPKVVINAAGEVHIEGYVNGTAGVANTFASLPSLYYPSQQIYGPAIQAEAGASALGDVFLLSITTAGGVGIQPRALADKAFFSAQWVTDLRLES